MTRRGSLIMGVALAAVLGAGATTSVPGLGIGAVSAAENARNEALQEGVADQFFHLSWNAAPHGNGERISGYIYNDYDMAADQIQLRVVALDAAGHQIGSYVERVLDTVPALDRLYFDVDVPARAASYRVAVESFNFQADAP